MSKSTKKLSNGVKILEKLGDGGIPTNRDPAGKEGTDL